MTPERWQQIRGLLDAAWRLKAEERPSFLDRACAGDSELLAALESLMVSDQDAGTFLAGPAANLAQNALAGMSGPYPMEAVAADLAASPLLGNYQILTLLGEGGMGKVYRARDTRENNLHRNVALKLLRQTITGDREQVQRLYQEAHSASSLNHPNIITVFEIGVVKDVYFIATEFIDGQTLEQRTAAGPFELQEVLDIGIQVASGLGAAHDAGIVHRDIKPANIMLRRDGYVKIVDFGVAKLIERQRASKTAAGWAVQTSPGWVVGTPRYMSPEQKLAQELDGRTDIFSLGVVLSEMLTGGGPFDDAGAIEPIPRVLGSNEPPMCGSTGELERVVSRMLALNREERYPSAHDLLRDLRNLKLDLALEARGKEPAGVPSARLDPAAPGQRTADAPAAPDLQPEAGESAIPALSGADRFGPATPIAPVAGKSVRVGGRWVPRVVACALVLLSGTLVLWFGNGRKRAPSLTPRDWILLTDFDNQTGNPLFDQSLITAFTVSLEQSRAANIYPRQRIAQSLARMQKPGNTRIDESVGAEIAVRDGIRIVVIPSIAGVGDDYRLAARIRDPRTGSDLKASVVRAKGKDRIMDGLDRLAVQVRADLGEPLQSINRDNHSLVLATTSSLEALKQYSLGQERQMAGDFGQAKLYYENALKIDPSFTVAHAALGSISDYFDKEEGRRHLEVAIRHIDNVTDKEKYGILTVYARNVEHSLEKAVNYQKVLLGLYPDYALVHHNLGFYYMELGRCQESVSELQQALRIDDAPLTSINLVESYVMCMGDLDAAIEAARSKSQRPDAPAALYGWMAYAYLGKGRLDDAVPAFRRAIELEPTRGLYRSNLAVTHLLAEQRQAAIDMLNDAGGCQDYDCCYLLGVAYERAGDAAAARKQWLKAAGLRQKYLSGRPDAFTEQMELAVVLAHLGERLKADALLQAVLRANSTPGSDSTDADVNFQTALVHAAQARTAEALRYLELAERHGYRDYVWVKVHPEFRLLTSHPRFVALIQRHLKGL